MPTWILAKDFRFEASHQLPHHDGKCARLHGHSWFGTIYVKANQLITEGPKQGMVIDYSDLKAPLQKLVEEKLDHYHLNDLLPNPTSEEIAKWMFLQLLPEIPNLIAVEIKETCTTSCRYQIDEGESL